VTDDCRGLRANRRRIAAAGTLLVMLFLAMLLPFSDVNVFRDVKAQPPPNSATITPSRFWGVLFGTSGDVQIDINRKGIAVRVEIPREFLEGVVSGENDTHFIESDIRNDYYYYSVVDESRHWSYDWDRKVSDAPCFKPRFSIYDPNAPWCVEIWNYQNGTFLNFTAPRFIRFHDLKAPTIAGNYNFTLFVADHNNTVGYPDFVNAFNRTLVVPVSMNDNPASITGVICDDDDPSNLCPLILTKGVVYARNINTGQVARAYVNQTTGAFNLTGLAPGDYELRASAGVYRGVAYSLSPTCPAPLCVQVFGLQRGELRPNVIIHLKRAPQVCGTIKYRNSTDPVQTKFLPRSLTDHPFLKKVGFKVLNITVEATDLQGHIFRFMGTSRDLDSDNFRILTGFGLKYAGLDPYGTEFAGLPPVDPGSYEMTVNIWITGYLQKFIETVTVSTAPGKQVPILCNSIQPDPIIMESGGVVTGTLEFRNLVDVETPHQGEASLEVGPVTDTIFGGNILIQVYDHTGVLRGIVVINGTRADGKTIYADSTTVRFYVVGFSEYYNRTWAGTWAQKDYGLPEDEAYRLFVYIRGYEQEGTTTISLARGSNRTVTVRMDRGGAILVTVTSFNNRPGTRAVQAEKPLRFLNLSIPIRARVYFYDSAGREVGYVERALVEGVNGVTQTTFVVLFAGMNWSLREIWFFGYIPTHITSDRYTVKAYTLGYVQQEDVVTFGDLASLSRVFLALLIGNDIVITAPIFAEPNLFWRIPEHDHVIGQVFSNGLSGAINGNLTAGITTLNLPVFGFGAQMLDGRFTGQGHFFYVTPEGTRYYDVGLDVGTYTAEIPEFGFNKHFMRISAIVSITFEDLLFRRDAFVNVISMARVIHGTRTNPNALVAGWVAFAKTNETVPLSWVRVEAVNATISRFVPTLDGRYNAQGALFLPAGTYNITFSVEFYQTQSPVLLTVNWNSTYPLLPPLGPLCPIADPSVCPTPSPAPSASSLITPISFGPLLGTVYVWARDARDERPPPIR